MEGTTPVEAREDPLAPYRERIMYGLAIASVILLLPFAINAFVQGHPGLGSVVVCAVLVLGIDAFAIYLKKSRPSR
jgi:hypothetical protein